MEWEIDKEMRRLGIRDPCDIKEYHQSLNDATRRDINSLLDRYGGKIIGLELWSLILRSEELRNVCNFDISYIFREEQEERSGAVEEYQRKQEELRKIGYTFDVESPAEFLERLGRLAL
jgi:hypothetical protein